MLTKRDLALQATTNDPRWALMVVRDASADGKFVYAVMTTGNYCRPSCGSRRPRPENVRFFANNDAAETAGFRPCKRCAPDLPPLAERNAALVETLVRQIESAKAPLTLDTLAQSVNISASHLHRMFKMVTGLTPKAYAKAIRAHKVKNVLPRCESVTSAIYEVGYNSSGRFYQESGEMLGMTPSSYRAGGANTVAWFVNWSCARGCLLVAASVRGVCAILAGSRPEPLVQQLRRLFSNAELIPGSDAMASTVDAAARTIGLDESAIGWLPDGSPVPRKRFCLWQALRKISWAELVKDDVDVLPITTKNNLQRYLPPAACPLATHEAHLGGTLPHPAHHHAHGKATRLDPLPPPAPAIAAGHTDG